MSRIADNLIERLKKEVALTELCRGYNIELQHEGKNLIGHCPFHEDRSPSFVITPSKNLWNCLGACQGGGDNIQLVMKMEKVSFRHAVEKLSSIAGLAPSAPKLQTRVGTEHPVLVPDMQEKSPQNDHVVMEHVVDFYHQAFLNQPQAMSYLQKRCCFHPEAAKHFKIGYANRTLGYRVPATTSEGRKLKAQLQKLGILRASGHEHLSGSVVIPLFDEHGNVVQLYGRKILNNLRKGTPDHLYLSGPLRGIFNQASLIHQSEILLCESLLDALTLWSAGLRNVTTTFGVSNFSEELWEFFKKLKPKRVILCFDNDEAGNEAAKKYAPRLAELGAVVLRASLPIHQDINEVARVNHHNATAALAACIEKATLLAGSPLAAEEKVISSQLLVDGEAITSSLAAKKEASTSEPLLQEPSEPLEKQESIQDEHTFTFGERHWRVRGLSKNLSYDTLKIQLRILRESNQSYHLDTLDLCNAKHRQGFIIQAVSETALSGDILKRDMGNILL